MTVALFSQDLILKTRIKEVALACGVEILPVKKTEDISQLGQEVSVFIVDLSAKNSLPDEMIMAIKAQPYQSKVVAFVSHIDEQAQESAHAAGADYILPRSRFVKDLEAILSGEFFTKN